MKSGTIVIHFLHKHLMEFEENIKPTETTLIRLCSLIRGSAVGICLKEQLSRHSSDILYNKGKNDKNCNFVS